MFEDLIIVFWVDPQGRPQTELTQELTDFADLIMDSRYYVLRAGVHNSICVMDMMQDIMPRVTEWTMRSRSKWPATVYFGFQGGPGWTSPEFHDILNKVATIPALFPSVQVEWLPDNWFDHPGLTPPDMTPDGTLEWLERQIINAEPEEIQYDFKGAHNDPAPF